MPASFIYQWLLSNKRMALQTSKPIVSVCLAMGPSVVVFWAPGAFVAGRLDDDELYALFLDLCRGQLGMPRRGAESLPFSASEPSLT